MFYRWFLLVPVLVGTSSARADESPSLTLQRVIELAKSRAPASVVARARVDEIGASLVGARRVATRNPVLSIDAGPRWRGERSTDVQGALSVPLDLGGRRAKRIAVADADIRRESFEAESVQREAIARAVIAYFELLHAERRVDLSEQRVKLACAAETTAQQRTKAGDAAQFEANLASGEVARAEGGVAAAQADAARARGALALALGVPTTSLAVTGDLADRALFEATSNTKTVRADLRALTAEVELAGKEASLARSQRWPSLDFRLTYQHEDDAEILLGGISFSLPVFDRGQGDAATAHARAKRAGAELQVRTAAISTQVESAALAYEAAVAAVKILEDRAVPRSIENETAATASYQAGKLELGSLLLIRRETLDTRREHLDRLLEAARAGVDLWLARGTTL